MACKKNISNEMSQSLQLQLAAGKGEIKGLPKSRQVGTSLMLETLYHKKR